MEQRRVFQKQSFIAITDETQKQRVRSRKRNRSLQSDIRKVKGNFQEKNVKDRRKHQTESVRVREVQRQVLRARCGGAL